MQRTVLLILFCCAAGAFSHAQAGPYPPAAGKPGSTAVHKDDPAFAAWAAGWVDPVHYGRDVDESWKTPRNALGKAEGTASGVVSLGEGGSIVLTFDFPIRNGDRWDFAVFENSYSDTFLELAFVEVSSDGVNFIRFENHSLTPAPVNAFGSVDPTDITGFAGKYRQGYGTPFDLQDLAERDEVLAGTVNLSRITHVRIVDIMGNGEYTDSHGNIIYDPYPTKGSAGFDLDAVGVRHLNTSDQAGNNPPDRPTLLSPTDNAPSVVVRVDGRPHAGALGLPGEHAYDHPRHKPADRGNDHQQPRPQRLGGGGHQPVHQRIAGRAHLAIACPHVQRIMRH